MIKILIVDDSPTETELIQHIIESATDMEVIGIARNGQEAIDLAATLKPDLITMDIHMPVMDGLQATRIIMAHNPTPIVIISSLINDESSNATFHILEAGALSALEKPGSICSPSFAYRKNHILDTLRSLADIQVLKKPLKKYQQINQTEPSPQQTRRYELVAMGASIGGPIALKTILAQLAANFPVPIVVVQHISSGFTLGFAQWLAANIKLAVKNAEHDEPLKAGTVYIAPEQQHLEVARVQKQLICKLVDAPPVSGFCPSITHLFQSIAKVCHEKAIGILLTGMSDDGATGLLELRQAQGHTLIQDQESSVVFGMSAVAQSLNAVDKVLELEHIAEYLSKICPIKSE